MKRALLIAVAAAILFHLADTRVVAQTAANPLNYFKTFFVTGNYVISGMGLNTTGAGSIEVSGVPEGKDVVAAFLYFQAVTRADTPDAGGVGAMFRGNPLQTAEGILAKGLGPGTSTCGAGGGGTGDNNGSKRAFTYRMDVLRYFPVDNSPGPNFGKLAVNGAHSVQLPKSNTVEPIGASLVVVYRDPAEPLRAVAIYDGAYSMDQSTNGMQLIMKGFYDGKPGPAKFSLIGGNGQANKDEILRFNEPALADNTPLATNAFSSSLGPKWDNPTFSGHPDDPDLNAQFNAQIVTPTPPVGGFTDQVTTSVSKENLGTFDCVTFSAAIFSTDVEDRDGDGLLDRWEESTTPILDPNGQPLPNLNAMGADPDLRDVFVQIDSMQTGPAGGPLADYSYGSVSKPAHSHQPGHEELKLVGDAFAAAPPVPDAPAGIRVHFDMGPNYPLGDPSDPKYNAEQYLVPRSLTQPRQAIDEAITLCTPGATDPEYVCQYSPSPDAAWPGTVGWKTGYRFLRDEIFNVTPPLPSPLPPDKTAEDYCNTLVPAELATIPGQRYACNRRFPENRMNTHHYALMVHHLGLPKSDLPCLNNNTTPPTPVPADANDRCVAPLTKNPDYHIPRTNGGIGDFVGADTLIALGAFSDLQGRPVGTPFQVATTLMHEFGHHFERRHGGDTPEPNCNPPYLSIMNYLYALRGLLDDQGRPHLDYSGGNPSLSENALIGDVDGAYRLGWYAPLATSYLAGNASAAIRRCDGSFAQAGENMVRIDARYANVDIDWDADNNTGTVVTSQDVNYNGTIGDPFPAADDWSNLHLNQIGSRRNIGALYAVPGTSLIGVGALSVGMTKGDLTKGDLTKGDLTKGDLTKGDLTKGDLTKGDLTKGDLGSGDIGRGDQGGGDLFRDGDPNTPDGEPDFEMVSDMNKTPPIGFEACVSGGLPGEACSPQTAPLHDVQLKWEFPNVVGLNSYSIYRVDGPELLEDQTWVLVDTVDHELGVAEYSTTDPKNGDGTSQHPPLVGGQQYTYFAVGNYVNGNSDPGNLETITAINDPAATADRNYSTNEDTLLTVAAPGVLANVDPDDPQIVFTAELVTGLSPASAGTLTLNADGSFTFSPALNFNGSVSFKYRARSGSIVTNTATVSISVTAVNDPPTISNIPDQTTYQNGMVGPIAFTIGDVESPETLSVSASSNNITLVPNANIVLGGTGANRTVTVTPVANRTGTATITLLVTDGTGGQATDTFVLTVQPPPTLVGIQNVPPAVVKVTNTGSAVPMVWQYNVGSTAVDSSFVHHRVTVTGPMSVVFNDTDPGSSSFRYDPVSRRWSFNLQTKSASGQNYPVGTYRVTITPLTSGFVGTSFDLKLK